MVDCDLEQPYGALADLRDCMTDDAGECISAGYRYASLNYSITRPRVVAGMFTRRREYGKVSLGACTKRIPMQVFVR